MPWYRFRSIDTKLGHPFPDLRRALLLKLPQLKDNLIEVNLAKKSLDARKRHNPFWLLQLEFATRKPLPLPLPEGVTTEVESIHAPSKPAQLSPPRKASDKRAIVIGSGPAGLFAALALGEAGVQTTLVERGKPVETRMRDIGRLRGTGLLNPESNVCFGEGGAGTYTDGKLYTRVKHPFLAWVMSRFVDFGGPEQILTDAHPHLGTDKLIKIIKNMRHHLAESGVRILFEDRMDQILIHNNRAAGIILHSGDQIEADYVVLGIGHSARETLDYLYDLGLRMIFKPFAIGVRAEHPQHLINESQYGPFADHPELGAAEYRLSFQFPDPHIGKRGVYSFCMCPGGFIVPTPTEPGHMALNGMSNANRSTPFANSGIVVQVSEDDLKRQGYDPHPLMGIRFQRDLELKTFQATNQPYCAPSMRITDFVNAAVPKDLAPTHFRPGAEPFPLHQILPDWIATPMREGFKHFNNRLKGYLSREGNIFAIETRTSSPVRIERGEDMECTSMPGLFPIGEGAGYAGGIVSAAIDGLKAAERIINA